LSFFLNPPRRFQHDPALIVSYADGRVVNIERVGGVTRQCFPVDLQRSCQSKPWEGESKPWTTEGSSRLRSIPQPASKQRFIVMVSVGTTGVYADCRVIARRIVFWKRVGDPVQKGELIGLIRFGSRVDVLFPAGTEATVKRRPRERQVNTHEIIG
jgi:phosphatidylserine decarboxylase